MDGVIDMYDKCVTVPGPVENNNTANYESARFDKGLQEKLILSTHNLVSDSSLNSFQLIVCRNVMIYFEKDLQESVFQLFDISLENLGYLALGAKETLRFSALSRCYKQVGEQKVWSKTECQQLLE